MWYESTRRYYRVHPEDICYLTFTLEAYEGLAIVTTVNKELGIVRVHIAPGWEEEFDAIVKSEAWIRMEAVEIGDISGSDT
ncbi:MAG: DUF4911 domain-containing protein [Syntrophobacterales bacterium]|nr:DUF4911 domain-containing protein [Syntrophobacterales bacterium]